MTLLALGLAVNLPEGRLYTILESLVLSGRVRRRGTPSSMIPGPRTAHYHLASPRHCARPGAQARRPATAPAAGEQTTQQPRRSAPVPRLVTPDAGGVRAGRAHVL